MESIGSIQEMKSALVGLSQQIELVNNLAIGTNGYSMNTTIEVRLFQELLKYLTLILSQPPSMVTRTCALLLYHRMTLLVNVGSNKLEYGKQRLKRHVENHHHFHKLRMRLTMALQLIGNETVYNSHQLLDAACSGDAQLRETSIISSLKKFQEITDGGKVGVEFTKALRKQIHAQINALELDGLHKIIATNHTHAEGENMELPLDSFSVT